MALPSLAGTILVSLHGDRFILTKNMTSELVSMFVGLFILFNLVQSTI